uniref:Methyltransferase-like protein 24 n=1 Tax=Hirondellea gigas TaxID=1518452 RepID=A0A6A7G6S4_9CRUS
MICMDAGVAPRQDGTCVVLSFGIKNEWSFDDAMASRNCTVYSFDPTMNVSDHRRGERIFFFSVGLDAARGNIIVKKNKLPVESYRDILNRIARVDSIIDYLKVDIESSELGFFSNVLYDDAALLRNVKQIGMEIHPGKNDVSKRDKFWQHLNRLQELGFRQVFSEQNNLMRNSYLYRERRVTCCYEILWVNEGFLKTEKKHPYDLHLGSAAGEEGGLLL